MPIDTKKLDTLNIGKLCIGLHKNEKSFQESMQNYLIYYMSLGVNGLSTTVLQVWSIYRFFITLNSFDSLQTHMEKLKYVPSIFQKLFTYGIWFVGAIFKKIWTLNNFISVFKFILFSNSMKSTKNPCTILCRKSFDKSIKYLKAKILVIWNFEKFKLKKI